MIRGVPQTILVAPDSFKGTFAAGEVAAAIGEGLRSGGREADLCPLADGGEGTAEALRDALGGELRTATVHDPLGREIEAGFVLHGEVAFLDTAAASGLGLVAEAVRDPFAASTAGTGELLLAAVAAGARQLRLGIGGSATTDGGIGAVDAIARGGGLRGARLVVLCDVRTVYEDAARVFGPQKGASPDDVRALTERLHDAARRLAGAGPGRAPGPGPGVDGGGEPGGRDPRGREMTGGAGGLSGALWAAHDAELVPGAAFVLDAVGYDARMRAARCVVTGEGRLDASSLTGKLVAEVATRARQAGVPCHVVCGTRELDAMGARVLDLERVLEATTLDELRVAGRELAGVI